MTTTFDTAKAIEAAIEALDTMLNLVDHYVPKRLDDYTLPEGQVAMDGLKSLLRAAQERQDASGWKSGYSVMPYDGVYKIEGPDGICTAEQYSDHEIAEADCEALNAAFEKGKLWAAAPKGSPDQPEAQALLAWLNAEILWMQGRLQPTADVSSATKKWAADVVMLTRIRDVVASVGVPKAQPVAMRSADAVLEALACRVSENERTGKLGAPGSGDAQENLIAALGPCVTQLSFAIEKYINEQDGAALRFAHEAKKGAIEAIAAARSKIINKGY